jgi:gamma-glutamyltranspeptidase/glutathione hydrolase
VTEAQRLAYADRDRWIGDPEHVAVPVAGLLHPAYLDLRADRIDAEAAGEVAAGDPWPHQGAATPNRVVDGTVDRAGTTHFVVVDGTGDVVSMTASVESIFGSARMAGGLFLNNQLTDFAFRPVDGRGRPAANAVAAGKRPRSSMAPSIVVDADGAFRMATGSPGGNSIIAYTIKSLVGVLDWGLTPAEAVALPNVVARGEPVRVERDRAPQALVDALEAYGLEVDASSGENSGLSVVVRRPDGTLEGGADPRREGTVGVPARTGLVVP